MPHYHIWVREGRVVTTKGGGCVFNSKVVPHKACHYAGDINEWQYYCTDYQKPEESYYSRKIVYSCEIPINCHRLPCNDPLCHSLKRKYERSLHDVPLP